MFISEPKDFYEAFKPLVYINCLAGISVFRQPNESGTKYLFIKLYAFINNLIFWITIYVSLKMLTEVVDSENTSASAVTMRKVLFLANFSFIIIAPLLVWLRKRELRDCVRRMAILDETFQAVFGVKNEYKKEYIRLIFRVISIIFVVIFVVICDTLPGIEIMPRMDIQWKFKSWAILYVLHYSILVMLLVDINFCTFVGYLRKKFQDMNDTVSRLTEKPATFCLRKRHFRIYQNFVETMPGNVVDITKGNNLLNKKLQEIRKVHLELCKLFRKMNRAFGIQNLLSMGMCFVMITGLFYTIYSAFSWDDFTEGKCAEIICSTSWVAFYVLKILMVNHVCWAASIEAERTGEVIYELLNLRCDEKLHVEIQQFGIQILQNPIRFNACGFFTLDYTFVHVVIGSVTTYLVILIQMSPESQRSTSNTSLAWNSTELLEN